VALAARFDEHLGKPVGIDQLLQVVGRLLQADAGSENQ
jgi:hypothetical protein